MINFMALLIMGLICTDSMVSSLRIFKNPTKWARQEKPRSRSYASLASL